MGKLADISQHTGAIADKRDGSLIKALLSPVDNALACQCLNAPGLAIGTGSKKKIKITNDIGCIINGKIVPIAAQEVAFTATTHDIADGYINTYVLTADVTGTVTIRMGDPVLIAATATAITLPPIPDGSAILGVVTISTNGAIFDATTTDLDAVTVTDLYYDCTGPFCTK